MSNRTDKEWEGYGKLDPYYGVIAEGQYQKENLDEAGMRSFFQTGKDHIDHALKIIDAAFGLPVMHRALDFGCGVGRLVIPLAGKFAEVVGLDVSESMLKEAGKNCAAQGITNVQLQLSDDGLTKLRGKFQFIHSFIVFQHIDPSRGLAIFEKLLDCLDIGGAGSVQFCYLIRVPRLERFKQKTLKLLPWLHMAMNIMKKRPLFYPSMEMNEYDCNRILALLQQKGMDKVQIEFTDHSGHFGVNFYFRKAQ